MTTRITQREWEDLSAYLDGQLSPKESARLEEKLQASADLRAALNELGQTRTILRSQPPLRAPRNFLLTPKMVRQRHAPVRSFQLFPAMRLASVLAMALFVLVLAGDLLSSGRPPAFVPVAFQSAPLSAPAAEMKSAPEAAPAVGAVIEAPAATAAPGEAEAVPQAAAKLAPGGTLPPAPTEAPAQLQDNGTGAEPYPPPAASAALAQPANVTSPAPQATQAEQALQAERNAVETTGNVASLPTWSGWRLLELGLALLVVVTAVWAFYLRRSRHL